MQKKSVVLKSWDLKNNKRKHTRIQVIRDFTKLHEALTNQWPMYGVV